MAEASAPGKLVIAGEYAVLEGAPAIATAVGVRARATVSSPGNLERNPLVDAVMATIREKFPALPVDDVSVSIDTDDFFVDGSGGVPVKLGLGSSAAALVALVGAMMRTVGGPTDSEAVFGLCCAAHKNFQGGRGSGIDVATAFLGGITGIRPVTGEAPPTSTLDWPSGLLMLPVWSGQSASTPELIARFYDFKTRSASAFDAHVTQLTRLADELFTSWTANKPAGELIAMLSAYDDALRAMDADAKIGIGTKAHEVLRAMSVEKGAVYKTSGAGGGDFGIAFSESRSAITALRAAFIDGGYTVLDSDADAGGLTVID
jgi:phosphomevalonate kinase